MGNRFSSGKNAISQCDRCNFRFRLHELRTEIIKTKPYQLKVCRQCWDPDHPQLQLGMYPVDDPQGVRDPRPDITYLLGGNTGLQLTETTGISVDASGTPTGGSRVFQWGWNPVGGSQSFDAALTPNNLVLDVAVGDVSFIIDRDKGAVLSGISAAGSVGKALGPLPITGVSGAGEVASPYINAFPITGVSSAGRVPDMAGQFPIQINTAADIAAPGVTFNHVQSSYYGGAERLEFYSSAPWAVHLYQDTVHVGGASTFSIGETWIYADAANNNVPTAPTPQLCFGRVSGAQDNGGFYYLYLDTQMNPLPFEPYGSWYTYSGFRLETRFSIPCPNNGNVYFPVAPYDGYAPVYVNAGATCSLSWSGNAAATLYDTYQSSVSIVGSKAFTYWNDNPGYLPGLTMGLVTAVSYTGGVFKIDMTTITPVTGAFPVAPISFIPVNPPLSFLSGVSTTGSVGSLGVRKSLRIAAPTASLSFNSQPWGFPYYYVQLYVPPYGPAANLALGSTLLSEFSTCNGGYVFADVSSTYPPGTPPPFIGFGYMSTVAIHSGYYEFGLTNPPQGTLPYSGTGPIINTEFVTSSQFWVDVAYQWDTYSTNPGAGTATFGWTGDHGLICRDTYAQCPVLAPGTEVWASISTKDTFQWLNSYVHLGTLVSIGYDSGTATFSMTYTVITPFTPYTGGTPVNGQSVFNGSGLAFIPIVINV